VTSIRIGCAQVSPKVGDLEGNRRLAKTAVRNLAVGFESRIVVLPELMSSGYVFDSMEEARSCGEPTDGPTISRWAEDAADYGSVIVGGFAELGEHGALYNSAAVLGPDGLLAVYRKAHLWDREKLWFMPGNLGFPVFETPIGRIGLLICWDIWLPDVPRLMAHVRLDPAPPLTPAPILDAAARVVGATAVPFNTVGLNLYRDGRDSVAPHHDHLNEIRQGFPIALVSLGATRRMIIRASSHPRSVINVDLEAGSLLLMDYATQLHYTHGVPKTTEPVGERISLAFRVKPTRAPSEDSAGGVYR